MPSGWTVARRTFWKRLPPRSLALFLSAVFFTFASMGFLDDIRTGARAPSGALVWSTLLAGTIAAGYAYAVVRQPWALPAVLAIHLGGPRLIARSYPLLPRVAVDPALTDRLSRDALGAILTIIVGYVLVSRLVTGQGLRYLRLQTEIALARGIHEVLAPAVHLEVGGYEALGRSFPATEIGGDLVDALSADGMLVGYVADVTGHGVSAGTLMAMLKSAARMRLRWPGGPDALFRDLSDVLFPLSQTNMFATCACVRLGPGGQGEVSVAGHLPILHVRRSGGRIDRLSTGGLPLALRPGATFEAAPIRLEPGDLLAVITDGLTEVEDARGRELGIEGIEAVLAARSGDPIERVFTAVLEAARTHGRQLDDQTVLLIRYQSTGVTSSPS